MPAPLSVERMREGLVFGAWTRVPHPSIVVSERVIRRGFETVERLSVANGGEHLADKWRWDAFFNPGLATPSGRDKTDYPTEETAQAAADAWAKERTFRCPPR